MTSSPTTRNRILKQGTGDNTNTWGDQQSSGDFDMIDVALDGVLQLAVSGPLTLSTANYADDQARRRVIKITVASTAAATITLPAIEKWYLIWNASTFDQIIASSGGGTSVTIKAGELVPVLCDASNVARVNVLVVSGPLNISGGVTMGGPLVMNNYRITSLGAPTANTDATTRTYVDSAIAQAVFTTGDFGVPIVPGDAGKLLTNNGATPNWSNTLSGLGLTGPAGTERTLAFQTAGVTRWGVTCDADLETGGNVGSDLNFSAYDDAGAFLGVAISITRARVATFAVPPTVAGATVATTSQAIAFAVAL